jgi:hypothetical protein
MVCHSATRSYLIGVLIEWIDATDIHSFWYSSFLDSDCTILVSIRYRIWSCTRCWKFLKNQTLDFFLIRIIDNVLFSFLYSIPVFSECNIVDHISAKNKLTWCCLQCCVIGASNSMEPMKLIEGSNQMYYLLVFLDFIIVFQVKWSEHVIENSLNDCIPLCIHDCDL